MNSKEQIPKPEESLSEFEIDTTASVDDFIKQLEEKEKDLHITSDLTIEVSEPDFDAENIPDFVKQEMPHGHVSAAGRPQGLHQAAGAKTRAYELQSEVVALQERIESLRAERQEAQEKSDRRLKDFESYKYRMDRERRGAFIDQISNLASQMLPVLDNLDRAIDSVATSGTDKSPEFQHFYDGVALVNQQVNEVLAEMGVQPISTLGETFDPNFHEAVSAEEREDMSPNLVLAEILRGYRIGNRVIRHSMVRVSTAPQNAKKPQVTPVSDDLETASSDTDADELDSQTPERD